MANNIINLDRKRNRRSRANSARWGNALKGMFGKRPSTPEPESRNVDVPYAPEKQHDKSNMSSIRPTTYSGFSGFIIHTN